MMLMQELTMPLQRDRENTNLKDITDLHYGINTIRNENMKHL